MGPSLASTDRLRLAIVARSRLEAARTSVEDAAAELVVQLEVVDDVVMDQEHAAALASAAAILMRAAALELRDRRRARSRAEHWADDASCVESRDPSPAGTPSVPARVKRGNPPPKG